jgi:hypothetical protein
LFWLNGSSLSSSFLFFLEWAFFGGRFDRLGETYPDSTLFGTNSNFTDPIQGFAGNCYILASMGAVAEFPSVLENVFLTKTTNNAGIYAVRFYIRGKPWYVTVDDEFFSSTYYDNGHTFAPTGDNANLWVPILEKAWAKAKGTYANSEGGWTQNGLRALTGAPVFEYWTYDIYKDTGYLPGLYENFTDDEAFTLFKNANDLDYMLGAGTDNYGDA